MYERYISLDDVINSICSNHTCVRKDAIQKAYRFAENAHKGRLRKTGDPYIMHSLRVAKLTADWGFESDVIISALLHDVIRNCGYTFDDINDLFGNRIAKSVNDLSKINRKISFSHREQNNEIDYEKNLLKSLNKKTLFIKFAECIDNMNTMDGMDPSIQSAKAQHTLDVILPLVHLEGAYQIVDALEELCFKTDHKNQCKKIYETYKQIQNENKFSTDQTLHMFTKIFTTKSYNLDEENTSSDCIINFIYNDRSIISISRQLNRLSKNLENDFKKIMTKENIALYDMGLILSNSISDPTDIFFKYYHKYFLDRGISILDYHTTTYEDSSYFLLCDHMDNLYRLFVKKEIDYMRYRIGNIVDHDPFLGFVDSDDINPIDTSDMCKNKEKIKIFLRDGKEFMIDEGATVLDCAFGIHSDIGFHFSYALINDSPTHFNADKRVKEGDIITIITTDEISAKIYWFRHTKTTKARNFLIKYFSQIISSD